MFLELQFCFSLWSSKLYPFYWTQILGGMRGLNLLSLAIFLVLTTLQEVWSHGDQPLSKIAIHKATVDLNRNAYIKASPTVLGLNVSLNIIVLLSSLSNYLEYVFYSGTCLMIFKFACFLVVKIKYGHWISYVDCSLCWGIKPLKLCLT